ncbi:hypothetical protein ABPG74_013297 [Tetrahymena malaccensis]
MKNTNTQTKKINFVFYVENQLSRQYVNFDDAEKGVLSGEIMDTDTNASTLAGARILLCEIHSELNQEMLTGNKKVEVYSSEQQDLQNKLREDWITLWKHTEYYELQEFLCLQDIYNTNDLSSYTYLIKLSEQGLQNLMLLRNISLVSSDELTQNLQSNKFTDFEEFDNLDDLIDEIQKFNQEEPNRNNTFIQFINKPSGWESFVKGRSFVPVNAIYKGVFKRKFEHWFTFNVAKGEYPDEELLNKTRAIIVPGSGAGAWEDIPWVINLGRFLNKIYNQFPHLRFIGICFGFQIMAQTFGGVVKQTEGRKKDPHFHVIGNEELRISQQINQEQFFKDIFAEEINTLFINKGHGDYVEFLPSEFFEKIGESDTSPNEIAFSKDKRMLCFQGHPEYSFEYSRRLMATFSTCSDKSHDWNWHIQSERFKELFNKPNDHRKLVQLINNFFRNY